MKREREPVSLLPGGKSYPGGPKPYGGFNYERKPWPMEMEVNRKWNLLTPDLEMIEMSCHEWVMLEWPHERREA